MRWPRATDYNAAIQNPPTCFGDAELRQGSVTGDPVLGLPLPHSGNFADVYRVDCPAGQAWAVKCFTRQVPDLRQRYQAISEHLQGRGLPFMVEFRYLDEGIRVGGAWHPALKMRWVEGLTLNAFVRQHAGNPALLEGLARMWVRLAQQLHDAGLAHGDLQSGNVLLVPGRKDNALALRLVDYDGMWVPALADRPPGEVGHADYQHPQRHQHGGYDATIDHFSHLIVYTSLRCLAVGGPALWHKHDNGENLLFRRTDFLAPPQSALWPELLAQPHAEARALAGRLLLASQAPRARAPFLPEAIGTTSVAPLTAAEEERIRAVLAPTRRVKRPALDRQVQDLYRGVLEGHTGRVHSVAYSPDGTTLASAGADRAIVLWDVVRGARRATFQGHTGAVLALAFSPDGTTLASAGWDETIRLWDVDTGENTAFLQGHAGPINCLAFSPDGTTLASGDGNELIKLWDAARNRNTASFPGHPVGVASVAFSPDGTTLASGGWDETIRLWDVATGRLTATIPGHAVWVASVAFRPDGKTLASGGGDSTIKLWDLPSGANSATLRGHPRSVLAVAFSPDGATLASAGWEETVRLWDVASGANSASLRGHANGVNAVAFSPGGLTLASAGDDRTVRVWNATPER